MGIGLKPAKSNRDVLREAMSIAVERAKMRTVALFTDAGKSFLEYAKANKGFQDITFSLISSIGFAVVKDGVIVHMEFTEGGNDQGKAKGVSLINSLVEQTNGVSLIAVAGEDYALYVESRNRDVITGSAQHTTSLLKQALKK